MPAFFIFLKKGRHPSKPKIHSPWQSRARTREQQETGQPFRLKKTNEIDETKESNQPMV
jgi:hypothetical protein